MNFRPLNEDYVASATIPTKLVSVASKSTSIQRLLKKREKSHKSSIDSIRIQCRKHSEEIDDEIRKESDTLKDGLDEIKAEIQAELGQVLKHTDEELVLVNAESFQQVSTTVQDLNEQRHQKINLFSKNLEVLEKKRSGLFKSVLNGAYKETTRIGHVLPYDLLNFVEEEIVRLNKITMDNYRSYAKTEADLKLQIEEEMRILFLEILQTKERHKTAVKMAKVKEVMGTFKRNKAFLSSSKLPLPELDGLDTHPPLRTVDLEMWSRHVKNTIDRLDMNAKKLVNLYRMAVTHIFNRFFEQLRALTDALIEDEESVEIQNPDVECSTNSEVYQQLVEDLTQLYTCDINELQTLWDSIAHYMESDIQNTHRFLEGSAHLWDAHFSRISESNSLILKDLDLVIHKHDRVAQNLDKKVNTTLDKLREDSNVMKLNQHLQEANKFLDSIGKLYSLQCNDEIKILKKHHTYTEQDIDLLISEIERFLEVTSKNEGIQARRSWSSLRIDTKPIEKASDEVLIPHQMKATQYQVDAVNNWMFGLWEAIRHYLGLCRSELSNQADLWLENIVAKLKKRLEVRLATHKPRYTRIKTMIYDVRLKEIEEHIEELQKLEESTKRHIGDSASFGQMSIEIRAATVKSYENSLKEMEEKLKKATKSQHVATCREQVETLARDTLAELNESFRENDELMEQNRDQIDRAICQFSASIKLFSEGGNYSRDEAKLFKKKIQKVKKAVTKKYHKVVAGYDGVKKETMRKFAHSEAAILERLDLCKKEFEHVEKICSKTQDLRHAIRSLTYEVKFKVHRIVASIDYYSEMSKITIWRCKNFEIMKETVEECLKKAQELAQFLTADYVRKAEWLVDRSLVEVGEMTKRFRNFQNSKSTIPKMDQKKTETRGIPFSQQTQWKYLIDKEDKLRLKWFKKNEARLDEIANEGHLRRVPEEIKEEMKQRMLNYFDNKDRKVEKPEEMPLVEPAAVNSTMKPVDKETRDLLYQSNVHDGRTSYLNERYKIIPEQRYYFPETSSFKYGWNMWEMIKNIRGSPFARQQVIRESFYRRRGVGRDPEWYKEPARLSPQICGRI